MWTETIDVIEAETPEMLVHKVKRFIYDQKDFDMIVLDKQFISQQEESGTVVYMCFITYEYKQKGEC